MESLQTDSPSVTHKPLLKWSYKLLPAASIASRDYSILLLVAETSAQRGVSLWGPRGTGALWEGESPCVSVNGSVTIWPLGHFS